MTSCVCGSGRAPEECCLPILEGKLAPTAEALMRSRYAAYVLNKLDHIERTDAPEAHALFDRLDAERFVEEADWIGLEVLRTEEGGPEDQTGIVDFIFRYRANGETYAQREIASFVRDGKAWLYKSSDINPKAPPDHVVKIGRNDPCPCGSGKKYKKCCGA